MKHFLRLSVFLICFIASITAELWAQVPVPPSDLSGTQLRTWLKTNWYDGRHTELSYITARRRMYNYIDNHPDSNYIVCVYGGYVHNLTYGQWVSNPDPINCEHTVPQSFFGSTGPAMSDIHHLFPTYSVWNSTRSDYAFNGIAAASVTKWMKGLTETTTAPPLAQRDGYSKFGGLRFEPRRKHKGNLARAIMYFYTMYPTEAGPITDVIHPDTMYAWHLQDPIDANEIRRNNLTEIYQGNRNPYIDHPEIAARAFNISVCSGTPSVQVSDLTITNLGTTSLTLTFNVGNADRRLVVGREGSAVSFAPSGNYAGANTHWPSAFTVAGHKILSTGTSGTLNITGLTTGQTYHFKVYEYCSTGPTYRTSDAPTISQLMPNCSATPDVQVSDLVVSYPTTSAMQITFSAGNGGNRLILMRANGQVNEVPVTGTLYSQGNGNFGNGSQIGSGNYVVYTGSGTTTTVGGIDPNTTYHLQAFEFCENGYRYLTTSAPRLATTTPNVCSGVTQQASNVLLTNLTNSGARLQFAPGNGNRRFVVLKEGSSASFSPVNNTLYTANTNFSLGTPLSGEHKAIFLGNSEFVNISGLQPNTQYSYQVFEACYTDPNITYLTTAAPTGSFRTLGVNEILISEYVEGSSNNKALEIFNGTGRDIDLSNYVIRHYVNGSNTASSIISLSGQLEDGATYVIAHTSAVNELKAKAQLLFTLPFTGNDAIVLYNTATSTEVDIFGRKGCDPGTAWTASGGYSTQNKTLRRKSAVCQGVRTNPTGSCNASSFPTLASQWDVFPQDNFDGLGEHFSSCEGNFVQVGTIATTLYCLPTSGQTLTVPFTASGIFNAGNQFRAELSSVTGSFENPVLIGQLTSISASGNISATIPGNTEPAANYRIRVISTDPVTIGPNNGTNLTIAPSHPNITNFAGTAGNTQITLNWRNPNYCYDQVMFVVRRDAPVSLTPSGNGSDYGANTTTATVSFASAFDLGGDQKVVYKNNNRTTLTVSGLENGFTYYVKAYTRRGVNWSAGIEIALTLQPSSAGDLFRTRSSATGTYAITSTALWEKSTDGGETWANSTTPPTSAANTITIRSGTTVQQTGTRTLDQLVIEAGATFQYISGTLTINNGDGDDVICYGKWIHNRTTSPTTGLVLPTFSSGAKFRVKTGGVIEVQSNNGGKGDAYANNETGGNLSNAVIWEDESVMYWNTSEAFTTATYFSALDPGARPIFRLNSTISIGASSDLTINAIVEVMTGRTLTFQQTGTKRIKFGIIGDGTLQSTTNTGTSKAGPIIITGQNAVLGISTLSYNSNGLIIDQDATVTLVKNVTFNNRSTGTEMAAYFGIEGDLDMQSFAISGTYSTVMARNGTVRTSNANGLVASTGSFQNTSAAYTFSDDPAGNGGLVQYYRQGQQLISNFTYNKLEITGSGKKLLPVADFAVTRDFILTGNAELEAQGQHTITLKEDYLQTGNAFHSNTNQGFLSFNFTSHSGGAQEVKGNGNPVILRNFTASERFSDNLLLGRNTPLVVGNQFEVSFNTNGDGIFRDSANAITVFGDALFGGVSSNYNLTGTLNLRPAKTEALLSGKPNTALPAPAFNNLIVFPTSTSFKAALPNSPYELPVNGDLIIEAEDNNPILDLKQSNIALKGSLLAIRTDTNALQFNPSNAGHLKLNSSALPQTVNIDGNLELRKLLVSTTQAVSLTGNLKIQDLELSANANLSLQAAELKLIQNATLPASASWTNDENSTLVLHSPDDQTLTIGSALTLHNLEVLDGGIKSANNQVNIHGDVTISGTAVFNAQNFPTEIKGDIRLHSGSAMPRNALTTLSGTESQEVIAPNGWYLTNLSINNTSIDPDVLAINLSDSLIVTGDLTLQAGMLDATCADCRVKLGGNLVGETPTKMLQGKLWVERSPAPTVTEDFGGIGAWLTPAISPGAMRIIRTTGATPVSIGSKTSILRNYNISAENNSGLNATLKLGYFAHELNGNNEATLSLYRKPTGGSWGLVAGILNTSEKTITATGVNSFSEWTLAEQEVLPVVLLNFQAKKSAKVGAEIRWQTASEKDNAFFSLYRSQEINSPKILLAKLPPKPEGSYVFNDELFNNQAYYHLFQTDLDGKETYLANTYLSESGKEESLVPYPQPVQDLVYVANLKTEAPYQLYDALGKLLLSGNFNPTQGIHLQGLPKGLYSLRIGTTIMKVVKE